MLSIISNFMKDSYIFGKQSAMDELSLSDSIHMDKEGLSFINDRSRTIIDKYLANLKY